MVILIYNDKYKLIGPRVYDMTTKPLYDICTINKGEVSCSTKKDYNKTIFLCVSVIVLMQS